MRHVVIRRPRQSVSQPRRPTTPAPTNPVGSTAMPPEDRFVPRFAAEPPQELLPYGRWADRLREEFLAACLAIEDEGGEPGDVVWYPDRTWAGRTFVPATCRTSANLALY